MGIHSTVAHGAARCARVGIPGVAAALPERVVDSEQLRRTVAGPAVRDHLPGRPATARAAAEATARLESLLTHTAVPSGAEAPGGYRGSALGEGAGPGGAGPGRSAGRDREGAGLRSMVAVAAVVTTVAALPRAVAWCADARLWEQAADDRRRDALVSELLRVTAPSPLLPRVAAGEAALAGCPVRGGDRLLLVARHAARAHRDAPRAAAPAPAQVAQLVFGAGPHACPGARPARSQFADLLAAPAPYRPTVVRARVDRRATLPAWRTLTIRADRADRADRTDRARRAGPGCGRHGTASARPPGETP